MMGKCDPTIARQPTRQEIQLAGHNKFDPAYTLSTYEPTIVIDALRIAKPELLRAYRAIRIDVDGAPLMVSARLGDKKVHGGKRISWDTARKIWRSV